MTGNALQMKWAWLIVLAFGLAGLEISCSPRCIRNEFPAAFGPRGLGLFSHRLSCDSLGNDSYVYVYLHPESVKDSASNLVAQYDGGDPSLIWTSDLQAQIKARGVTDVSQRHLHIAGVEITTVFGSNP